MSAHFTPPTFKEQIMQPCTDARMLGMRQHRLPKVTRLGRYLGEWGWHRPAAVERHHRSETLAVRVVASVESEGVGEALTIHLITLIADDCVNDLVLPLLLGRGRVGACRELDESVIASISHLAMIPSRRREALLHFGDIRIERSIVAQHFGDRGGLDEGASLVRAYLW